MSGAMSYAELTKALFRLEQNVKALGDKYDYVFRWVAEHMTQNTEALQNLSGEVKTSRMECLNNCQMLANKFNECQMIYFLDGNGGNNGASQAPNFSAQGTGSAPTPSAPSGSQPKDSAEPQAQGLSCPVGVNVEAGARVGVPQPTSSRESLRQLVEAAEIHGARRKVASSTKSSAAGASRGSEQVSRSNNFDIQEIPTASVVTVCDNELACKEPAQSGSSNNLFFCPYCPRSFEHKHSRSLHIRSCKRNHEEEMKKLKAEEQAKNHEGVCADLAVAGGVSKKMNEMLKKKMGKMIKCGYCDRTFPTQHQVNSHERVHTGDRPFACYICEIKFAHGGNMIKHIKSKHPNRNPYVCRQCKDTFKTNSDIQNHRKECNPHRRVLQSRRSLPVESITSSDNEDSLNNGRQTRNSEVESEGTATASENEDYVNAQQDRRIVPVPAANAGYPSVGPRYQEMGHPNDPSMPMLAIKYETNSNETMVPDAVFPGTATLHSQFMTSSTYQCTTGGPTPVLREIKVETLRTASVPVHYPGVVPNFTLANIKQEMPD